MLLRERQAPLGRGRADCHDELPIEAGWEAASCAPGAHRGPQGLDGLDWLAATVPGTAAAALRGAGRWSPGEPLDLDAEDWWFRASFEAEPPAAGEEVVLRFGGIATVAQVFLNGELLFESASMFHAHEVEVGGRLRAGGNDLAIRCLALGPLLEMPRKPRARWRTKLVANGLRFQRTMLLGRMPGPAPGPQAVGPWRGVSLARRRLLAVERLETVARLDGDDGVLEVAARLRPLGEEAAESVEVRLSGPSGEHSAALGLTDGGVEARGSLRVPDVARWWPHTHGEPALHEVSLAIECGATEVRVDCGRAGFRELAPGPGSGHDVEADGLDLHLNGVPVFARGAVWSPVDPVGLAPGEDELRDTVERLRDAGMNMLRLPGTGVYESPIFHDLCDELGIMVWQDFMFANLDYPIADEGFRRSVEREATQVLAAVGSRPSLSVLCGNSEVEQQAAMLGLDPALGRGELFGELLPRLAGESPADAVYLSSAPFGGELPFRTDAGVANYFGVGGYRRPLEDARRAEVRFASECLAFANLGDADGPKSAAISDAGVEWDFGDVRDHYLGLLRGVDPAALRAEDPARYLALSRAVSGEAMAAVFGEWRRAASPCHGGLVLWSRDLEPGAGWGLLDCDGRPKVAYHRLRAALAPQAVWMTDEGLNGVDVHLVNERREPFVGRLRVALYRDFEQPAGEALERLVLAPGETLTRSVEGLLGRFADVSWAYRFGPPAQDLVAAALEREVEGGFETVSKAFQFPAGRPAAVESPAALGLEAALERGAEGALALRLRSRRFVEGLRVSAPGFEPCEDAISLEPGVARELALLPGGPRNAEESLTVAIAALNLEGAISIAASD